MMNHIDHTHILPLAGQSILDALSSPVAMAVYLIILMLLIAVLTAYILVALHAVRKNAESAEAEQTAKPQKEPDRPVEGAPRFSNLHRIDREPTKSVQYESKSLAQICDGFRDFAASRLGLYYDIADIRRFVAGLGMGRLVILRGISGTGKTSLAYAAGEYFGNPATIVPIQPMWKERSDIIGYFNEFTGRFNETTLLCKLYEAGGREDIYITVLDEVNISRIEYYFAEFLSLLELPDPKKRELDVVSDSWDNDPTRLRNGKLLLPENMWFIGTANNDDSTFAISDKVYDRAAVIDLDRKSVPFAAKDTPPARISYQELNRRFAEARQTYSLSAASREKLGQLESYLAETFRISFGNRIMRQIEDYVPVMTACGGSESGALDDILCRKILRKLEQLSPALIRSELPGLLARLEDLFGADALPLCKDYLERMHKST
jgi:hypothetical protein